MGGGWASGAVDAEDATDAWCEQAWRAWRGQRIHRARKDGEWRAGVAPLGAMHLRTLASTQLLRPRVPPQPTITPPSHMIPWNTHLRQADECCRGPTHAVLRLSTANLRNTARSQTVLTTNTTNTNADKTRTGLTLGATAAQLATQQCQRRPRPTPRSFLSLTSFASPTLSACTEVHHRMYSPREPRPALQANRPLSRSLYHHHSHRRLRWLRLRKTSAVLECRLNSI